MDLTTNEGRLAAALASLPALLRQHVNSPRHLQMLRGKKLLPLATLFEINRTSPYYNEREKSSIFYAESWALIHYLTHGQGGRRQPQLA